MLKRMSDYTYHCGLQLRIYPSGRQKQIIKRNAGASRFVYNRLVAIDRERSRLKKSAHLCPSDRERLSYLNVVRSSMSAFCATAPFLAEPEIDSDMIQQAQMAYSTAWKKCREEGSGFPTLHKKKNAFFYRTSNHYSQKKIRSSSSLCGLYEGTIRFEDRKHIRLPKIGRIRFSSSKKLIQRLFDATEEIRIGSVQIRTDETGNSYASLSLASDFPFHDLYLQTGKAVGIDMNLTNFFYDSDGKEVPSPKFLRKSEKKLKKAQKKLSRKAQRAKKDSRKIHECRNYEEQRSKLARLHKHVANQRRDFVRRLADEEVKTHDYLFAEDLKVSNLVKNHRLAKAISDSGWRMFLDELKWCASKRGKTCILINPRNTTQTCSSCGYVCSGDTRITLGVEEWDCPQCGVHHIRDYNAAVNIKENGLALLCSPK